MIHESLFQRSKQVVSCNFQAARVHALNVCCPLLPLYVACFSGRSVQILSEAE